MPFPLSCLSDRLQQSCEELSAAGIDGVVCRCPPVGILLKTTGPMVYVCVRNARPTHASTYLIDIYRSSLHESSLSYLNPEHDEAILASYDGRAFSLLFAFLADCSSLARMSSSAGIPDQF